MQCNELPQEQKFTISQSHDSNLERITWDFSYTSEKVNKTPKMVLPSSVSIEVRNTILF